MIIITIIGLMYFQVNEINTIIKDELFYMLQNCQIAFLKEDLALNQYTIDASKLENQMADWNKEIVLKYKYIIKVNINKINILNAGEYGEIQANFAVTFKPLIKLKDNATINVKESIKLSLLKYNDEDL